MGTGTADGQDIITDVIGGDFSTTDMKCRLFHGDQTNYKPARVICSSFTTAITSSHLLWFAFKVYNPSVSPQASIPFFVYTSDLDTMYKTNFATVENAVYLRNTFTSGTVVSNSGSFITPANELQTSNTYLQMVGRNIWSTTSEDYYLLFFNFPLRVNGVVTGGCTDTSGNVYGNAYYHKYLWVIVCDFTSRNMGVSNSYALRIFSFYTPWFYLSSSEKQVTAYQSYTREITSKTTISDFFPQLNPKTSSTDTFDIVAIHEGGSLLKGTRDDYRISFTFSTSASDDITYMKLIAVVFPTSGQADYLLLGQDCVEDPSSEVEIEECWIEQGSRLIWIRPVIKTSYTSDMVISVVTRDLAIRNPVSITTVYKSHFQVKFYSWENTTQPALSPISNSYNCFLIINSLPANTWTYSDNPSSYPTATYAYLRYPHQRYYLDTPYSSLTHYAPFEFLFRPSENFNTQSGANTHKITVFYGTDFGDNSQIIIRDLQVYRPVCYLANNRIRQCSIHTTANKITMSFQFALSAESEYHVMFGIMDPRNADVFGFLPTKAISDIRVEYILGGTSTVKYTETQKFPSLFSLPSGASQGPFRGISDGTITYGHTCPGQLNAVNMLLTFNRTDITGLVFEIPLRDNLGNFLYTSGGAQTNAFLSTEDGSTYPCGNHGLSAGGNAKCIIQQGDFSLLTSPTRIIMTDFTYVSQMNCRLVFTNPETVNSYFSIRVKAYGGTKTASNLYGDKFMGEWDFTNVFKTVSGTASSGTYARETRNPSYSPWRNNTSHYVFSRSETLYSGRMSVAQVLEYDSGSSYADDEFCRSTLGSNNDYDDLLQYTLVSGGRTYRYAYFVRTWPSNVNMYLTSGGGWDLSYIKCKFYAQTWTAYWFFSDTSIEVASNTYAGTAGDSLATVGISAPLNLYYDTDYRTSDGTDTNFVVEMDVTPMMTSAVMSNFDFANNDEMVLVFTFNRMDWGGTLSCHLLGGIVSTSRSKQAVCQTTGDHSIMIIRYVAGFVTDPLLATNTNMRVKFKYVGTALDALTSVGRSITVQLYANYDSYYYTYQPIVSGAATQINNCYDADNSATCYITHTDSSTLGVF